jgi:cyclic pyranopterin phosphate synthase
MQADAHGRQIGYLRLSLTSACPMRCAYCRPKAITDPPGEQGMSAITIETMVRHLVAHWGLRKVRLTGGEPTMRRDLVDIIQRLSQISGLDDLAMTTNGLTLARDATTFCQAGLGRLNVSLDSLNPERFERMTGVNGRDRVVAGIHAAMKAGLQLIRLNTVVLAGENETELPDLVRFAAERSLEIRFIELMPMGPLSDQWADRYVPELAMRKWLNPIIRAWQALDQGHDSARRFIVELDDGHSAMVGFITPMSCNFCGACNRLRLTSHGDVYPCLMDEPRGNVRTALEPRFDPKQFDQFLRAALQAKSLEHPVTGFTAMTVLGG